MTSKEKAIELVEKYVYIQNELDEITTFHWVFAQKCAMILAKEITNEFINKCCEHQNRKFWEQVQEEISLYNG